MAKGFKKGAGGANPLNLKVVGGTTAPENPRENTIWVQTDIPISSWAFSATQPDAPAEGMAWILTDTAGTVSMNTLKKNALNVYPVAAKQYVGGTWVDKPGSNFQDGVWKDWYTYLFKDGDECTDLTGGWISVAASESSYNTVAPTKSNSNGILKATITNGGNYRHGLLATSKKIDLAPYSKLHFDIKEADGYENYVGVHTWSGATYTRYAYAEANSAKGKVVIDVSSLNGSYNIALDLGTIAAKTNTHIGISEAYLEV